MKKCAVFSVLFVIYWTCFVLLSALGIISFSLNGFGVDGKGNLYIGKGKEIRLIALTSPEQTLNWSKKYCNRGYAMTIKNDIFVIATGNYVSYFDLDGRLLCRNDDKTGKQMRSILSRNTFGIDDVVYRYRQGIGGYKIIREEGGSQEIAYSMPWLDKIVYALLPIMLIAEMCVIIYALGNHRKFRS